MKRNVIYALLGLLLLTQYSFANIAGPTSTCIGMYAGYNAGSSTTGGGWYSSNTAVATIDVGTGVALGVSVGTTTISYTWGASVETMVLQVTPMPAPITYSDTTLVPGETTTFSDAVAGGRWISVAPIVATVDSLTGVITAHNYGHANINYSLGACGQEVQINVRFPAVVHSITQAAQLSAYPNPTNGTVNITWGAAASTGVVTISDITGRKVYSTTIDMSKNNGVHTLDLSGLANGLYLLNVSSATVNYNSKLEIRK
jgi:hypothetical protein